MMKRIKSLSVRFLHVGLVAVLVTVAVRVTVAVLVVFDGLASAVKISV